MSLAALFSASGASPVMQSLAIFAQKVDEMEANLAQVRDKVAAFDRLWLPQEVRRESAPRFAPVTWGEKFAACNGAGDYNRFAHEIVGAMDAVIAKQQEWLAKVEPPPEPPKLMTEEEWAAKHGISLAAAGDAVGPYKRGPGRPRNA